MYAVKMRLDALNVFLADLIAPRPVLVRTGDNDSDKIFLSDNESGNGKISQLCIYSKRSQKIQAATPQWRQLFFELVNANTDTYKKFRAKYPHFFDEKGSCSTITPLIQPEIVKISDILKAEVIEVAAVKDGSQ